MVGFMVHVVEGTHASLHADRRPPRGPVATAWRQLDLVLNDFFDRQPDVPIHASLGKRSLEVRPTSPF
jgi:hypothetical protein